MGRTEISIKRITLNGRSMTRLHLNPAVIPYVYRGNLLSLNINGLKNFQMFIPAESRGTIGLFIKCSTITEARGISMNARIN